MKICLVGYMGAGKSLVANKLAFLNNFDRVDLDFEISKRVGLSVSDIFETKGEIYFRKVEREVLVDCLSCEKDVILSLGGGTPCYYNNMEFINEMSKSIYLRAGVNTLIKRLLFEKEKRPLIAKVPNENLPAFVGQHLFERNQFYNQAKIIVDTDNLTLEEIVEKILEIL